MSTPLHNSVNTLQYSHITRYCPGSVYHFTGYFHVEHDGVLPVGPCEYVAVVDPAPHFPELPVISAAQRGRDIPIMRSQLPVHCIVIGYTLTGLQVGVVSSA